MLTAALMLLATVVVAPAPFATPAPECHKGETHGRQTCPPPPPPGTIPPPSPPTTTPPTTPPPSPIPPTTAAPTTVVPPPAPGPTPIPDGPSGEPPPPPPPSPPARPPPVAAIGVGQGLPDPMVCAARVEPRVENRPENVEANRTRATSPNDNYNRITGEFAGSTDEIIQWAACKWGLDPDWARAWVAIESWWFQTALGDWMGDPDACVPGHPLGSTRRPDECPQSVGLMQIRFVQHPSAFEDDNAIWSSAYNVDYSFAVWRSCFEGEWEWLNEVDRGRDYAAGDGLGCMAAWRMSRWHTDDAVDYIDRLRDRHYIPRVWEQPYFPPATSR